MMDERELTPDEFQKLKDQCLASGHQLDPERRDYADYPGFVIIDGKLIPAWMAAIFGELAKTR